MVPVREFQTLLPQPYGLLEDIAHAQSKRRRKLEQLIEIKWDELTRVRGVSEASRRLRIAWGSELLARHRALTYALPCAVSLPFYNLMGEKRADQVLVHPGREMMHRSDSWKYMQRGEDDGALTQALSLIPGLHADLLRNLSNPNANIRDWVERTTRLTDELGDTPEARQVGVASLLLMDWSQLRDHALADIVLGTPELLGYFAQVFVVLLRYYLPGWGQGDADVVAIWMLSPWMNKARDKYHETMPAIQAEEEAAFAAQFERRLSPLRAAFEILQHNPELFAPRSEAGFELYIRLRVRAAVQRALIAKQDSDPYHTGNELQQQEFPALLAALETLGADERYKSVSDEFAAIGQFVKKHSGMFAKKERAKVGLSVAAYWLSLRAATKRLAAAEPMKDKQIEIVQAPDAELRSLHRQGSVYVLGLGLPLAAEAETGAAETAAAPSAEPTIDVEPTSSHRLVETGHMFVDMKDFTSKTARYKERDMAEFMRWDFYDPMLREAKKYYQGMSHLEDRGGIFINNLIGDALSASGNLGAMVDYALDLRRIFHAYMAKLVDREALERHRTDLKNRRPPLLAQAKDLSESYKKAKAQYDATPTPELRALLHKLRDHHESVRRRIQLLDQQIAAAPSVPEDEVPEFGIFIGYGTEPVRIEFRDDVFGTLGVAIAERINEAARGTARSARLLAAHERAFAAAKAKDPVLRRLAFDVWVGKEVSVELGSDAETVLLQTLAQGPEAAQAKLPELKPSVKATDVIYNAGLALSGRALVAYFRTVKVARFAAVMVSAESYLPALQPYWAPPQAARLVALWREATDPAPAWIARYVGGIEFKGFEDQECTRVFELVVPGDRGFAGLAKLVTDVKPCASTDELAAWVDALGS